jgi:hypothetical protein
VFLSSSFCTVWRHGLLVAIDLLPFWHVILKALELRVVGDLERWDPIRIPFVNFSPICPANSGLEMKALNDGLKAVACARANMKNTCNLSSHLSLSAFGLSQGSRQLLL